MNLSRLISIFLLASAFCLAGDEHGNGGDPDAVKFVSIGYRVLSILKSQTGEKILLTPSELERFEKAIKTTRVSIVEEELFNLEGDKVAAINLPDPLQPSRKLIKVNRKAFRKSTDLGQEILWAFVFHEYLDCAEIDDKRYRISAKLEVTDPPVKDLSTPFVAKLGWNTFTTPFPLDIPLPPDEWQEKYEITSTQEMMRVLSKKEAQVRNSVSPHLRIMKLDWNLSSHGDENILTGNPEEPGHIREFARWKKPQGEFGITLQSSKPVRLFSNKRVIKGTLNKFDEKKETSSEIAAKFKAALESYEASCAKWLEDTKKSYVEYYAFGDCGWINSELKHLEDPQMRSIQFKSNPVLYLVGGVQ